MNKVISKVELIQVGMDSSIRVIERSLKIATDMAYSRFGIDGNGHCPSNESWERCNSSVVVKFEDIQIISGYMGSSFTVTYCAWLVKFDEEED